MNLDAAIAGAVFIIIAALVVTNPTGDTAVLSGFTSLGTGLSSSLQKGVK